MTEIPPPLTGPENDYSVIMDREPTSDPTSAVVIPTFDRPRRLDAVLAGLVQQTHQPDQVVIADDGSTADIQSIVGKYQSRLPITFTEQDDLGFRAGQARNLGASAANVDVVIFVDSDCIPDPNLVSRHLWWHQRASGVVVIGARFHIDGDDVTPSMVGDDFAAVRALAEPVPADGSPDDWRRLFYRRNRKLRIGDGAFRAVVSSNMSLSTKLFDEVGGFPDDFHGWGGEDTELGWRLWNAGAFIAVENEAIVFHQLEPDENRASRDASQQRIRLLMADRVPHRFYRKGSSSVYSVPRVSWIVSVRTAQEADSALKVIAKSLYADIEIVFTGPIEALEHVRQVTGNTRVRAVDGPDVASAIQMARGEFVVLFDARLSPHDRLVTRGVRQFDLDPRVGAVRVSYAMRGAGTYRRFDDLQAVDDINGEGAPLFALVRTREVRKMLRLGRGVDWKRLFGECRLDLLINDTVTGPASEFKLPQRSRLPLGFSEVTRVGAEESARTLVRSARARASGGTPHASRGTQAPARDESSKVIRYLGWTGHSNLGDDAMLSAVKQMFPDADVDPVATNPDLLMLGGGTLINSNGDYLRKMERLDSPRLDRVIFGTGVRGPSYWGESEPSDRWWSIFESALGVWVRGPRSEQHLRDFGYKGDVEMIGDPALMLRRPNDVERIDGRVIVSPIFTGGMCWGSDDGVVFDALATTVDRFVRDGRSVALMSAHPADDRWIIEIMRQAGHPNLEYIAGYADVDRSLAEIASAEVILGERLHSVVLAAAVGTPFVAIEYRPKLADFAASVGATDRIVRTDNVKGDELYEMAQNVVSDTAGQTGIDAAVEELRQRIAAARDVITDRLR